MPLPPQNLSWLQNLFYAVLKRSVRVGARAAFSEVEIRGMNDVPWEEPCIVSPNHPNAFLDALLVGAFAPTKMSYMARSDIFGSPFDWFLHALQMVPVYRRRDGYEKLALNEQIFAAQRENLRQDGSLLIHSEAAHAHTYPLRPLSKGSARFAAETHQALDRPVWLVPSGINYYHLRRPGFKLSLIFGTPIRVDEQVLDADGEVCPRRINALRDKLAEGMKDCLLLPEADEDLPARVDRINRHNESLAFPEMKEALTDPDRLSPKSPPRPAQETAARAVDVLNAPPIRLMTRLMEWVDDPVFALSLKFATGLLVLPVWWLILFGVGMLAGGWTAGVAVALLAVATLFLRRILIRRANPPHVLDPDALPA